MAAVARPKILVRRRRHLCWRHPVRLRHRSLLICLVALAGCSSLVPAPYDTPSQRASKTWKRVMVGVGTLGLAEIWLVQRSRQYERHWVYWFDRLSLARAIEGARTQEGLTRAFGGIPSCSGSGPERLCQWTADSRTYSVVISEFRMYSSSYYRSAVDSSGSEVYRLTCALPRDGSDRSPGSCTHVVNEVQFSENDFRHCFARWQSYCPRFQDVITGVAKRKWENSEFVLQTSQ